MTDLKEQIEATRADATERLARATTADEVEALRHELLGRSGGLTSLLRGLGEVPAEERPAIGQLANAVRIEVEATIAQRLMELRAGDLDARRST